jgi:hypothetical protein
VAEVLRRQGTPEEEQPTSPHTPPPVRAADEATAYRAPRRRARDDVQRKQCLTARFSADEKSEIKAAAKRRGIAIAHLIGDAVMDDVYGNHAPATPHRTALDDAIDELAATRTQVARIGTNLNQIAHRINTGDTLHPTDRPALAAVHQALAEVRRLLTDIDATADKVAGRSRR